MTLDTLTPIFQPILQWVNAHPHFAGFVVFIISVAESVAIIGTIIPGTIMMTFIGALAGSGVISLESTMICAILGAIVGDGISYWIGHYYKDRLRIVWPFRSYPNILESGEKFFHKYGGMSVLIGRFVGPVRALVPLVAGMLNMKPLRFYIYNILSAIGWAPAYMLPGILFGAASREFLSEITIHALLILLFIALFVILCLWMIQKIFFLIGNQVNQALNTLWHSLQKSRYFHLVTTVLKHADPAKTHGQLTLAFYFILTTTAFLFFISYLNKVGSNGVAINSVFFHLWRTVHTPFLDNLMIGITFLGEKTILLPVMGGLFVWFAWTKRGVTAWHVLILAVLSAVSIEVVKHFTASPRPWGIVQSPTGSSLPSGHTTLGVVFYFGLALLLVRALHNQYSRLFYSAAILIIIAVATSRIYLGAHWLTDVIAGLLLGSSILMFVVLSYNRWAEKKLNPAKIALTTFLLFIAIYSCFSYIKFDKFKQNHAQLDWPIYTINLEAWWQQKGAHLPLYRTNRFGISEQILNLQWVGDITTIKNQLLQNHWEAPRVRDWMSILHRISDVQSAEHLPLILPLYLDKAPALVLIKRVNHKKLYVLRLWDSHIVLKNSKQPLWVGVVGVIPRTYSWLFNRKPSTKSMDLTPTLLFEKIPNNIMIKPYLVKTPEKRSKQEREMLLIKPLHPDESST